MNKILLAIAAAFIVGSSASAQSVAHPAGYVPQAAGPWRQNAIAGIQSPVHSAGYSAAAVSRGGTHSGQPIALMAVGGAAIILGALMDNDARPFLMVGGSVLGLYGLYLYLR